jgi:hypothetical protein
MITCEKITLFPPFFTKGVISAAENGTNKKAANLSHVFS